MSITLLQHQVSRCLCMYIAVLKHSLPCFQYVYCPLEIGIELFSTYFALLKCLLPRCRQHLLPRCRQHLLPCCHQRLLPRCLCLYCPVVNVVIVSLAISTVLPC